MRPPPVKKKLLFVHKSPDYKPAKTGTPCYVWECSCGEELDHIGSVGCPHNMSQIFQCDKCKNIYTIDGSLPDPKAQDFIDAGWIQIKE